MNRKRGRRSTRRDAAELAAEIQAAIVKWDALSPEEKMRAGSRDLHSTPGPRESEPRQRDHVDSSDLTPKGSRHPGCLDGFRAAFPLGRVSRVDLHHFCGQLRDKTGSLRVVQCPTAGGDSAGPSVADLAVTGTLSPLIERRLPVVPGEVAQKPHCPRRSGVLITR
jgi:hypothetical protein